MMKDSDTYTSLSLEQLQQARDGLLRAFGGGILTVTVGDTNITYQSLPAVQRALRFVEGLIQKRSGSYRQRVRPL